MPRVEVVELAGLPACDANVSDASVLVQGGRAFIAYDVGGADRGRVALVRLEGVRHVVTEGPNDEAFHRHRFYSLGLRHYAVQEICGSPWIEEVASVLNRDGDREALRGYRHFVFALKETTVDAIARDAVAVGVFGSHREAMGAAAEE